jgi:DNA-binding CsgD family transcriptional regulator
MIVTPVLQKTVPTADLLQGLYDLTPAEARVARAVAERRTIDGIAESFGLSRETVRTQIKAVLAKTGVSRNIDLATLLSGAGFPGQRDV